MTKSSPHHQPQHMLSPKAGSKGSDNNLANLAHMVAGAGLSATGVSGSGSIGTTSGSGAVINASRRGVRCFRWCGWNPQTRLVLFFVCYFIFLSPVLVALIREFYGHSIQRKRQNLLLPLMHPGGPKFLFALSEWLLVLLVVYFIYRVLGRKLGIKLHDKTLAKHKDDLLRLCYFGMTMAAVGGIATRIEEGVVNHETGLSFIPLTLCYCIFFTVQLCRFF